MKDIIWKDIIWKDIIWKDIIWKEGTDWKDYSIGERHV